MVSASADYQQTCPSLHRLNMQKMFKHIAACSACHKLHLGYGLSVFLAVNLLTNCNSYVCHASSMAIAGDQYNCIRLYGERSLSVDLKHRAEPYNFKFNAVLPESTGQLEIFERELGFADRHCSREMLLHTVEAVGLCSWNCSAAAY
jgi:hypothetical protein